MLRSKSGCEGPRLGIDDEIHVALTPQTDLLRPVGCNFAKAHGGEESGQLFRLRMGIFDELKPVGPHGIGFADFGGCAVVRKRTHRQCPCAGLGRLMTTNSLPRWLRNCGGCGYFAAAIAGTRGAPHGALLLPV